MTDEQDIDFKVWCWGHHQDLPFSVLLGCWICVEISGALSLSHSVLAFLQFSPQIGYAVKLLTLRLTLSLFSPKVHLVY